MTEQVTPAYDWAAADELSDRIIELVRARVDAGVDPIAIYAGLLLGLLGFMSTAPRDGQPASFRRVEEAVEACLLAMTAPNPRPQ